jgi:hypothetical protein
MRSFIGKTAVVRRHTSLVVLGMTDKVPTTEEIKSAAELRTAAEQILTTAGLLSTNKAVPDRARG